MKKKNELELALERSEADRKDLETASSTLTLRNSSLEKSNADLEYSIQTVTSQLDDARRVLKGKSRATSP